MTNVMKVDYEKLKLFLQQLDRELKRPVNIIAFGGTALTLVGLKGL